MDWSISGQYCKLNFCKLAMNCIQLLSQPFPIFLHRIQQYIKTLYTRIFSSFNIITSFIPDYMHAVLLGVVRQFLTLWIDSSNHTQPWYIGTKVNVLNERLLTVKRPKELTPTPSSLDKMKFWKASEFKSWLLYYSMITLNGILPTHHLNLNHWALLVYAVYTLLMTNIPRQVLEKTDVALHIFVMQSI